MNRAIWLLWITAALMLAMGGAVHASDDDHYKNVTKYEVPTAPEKYLAMKNPNTSESDLKKGKRYYKAKCSECHGDEGEGDPEDSGVVAFKNAKWMKTRSDGQLFYIAMFGAGKDAEMEGYGPESDAGMSEERIWQIIAYIRTLVDKD